MAIECNATKVGVLTLLICILFVVFAILFGVAWDIISPTEVGILASSVSKSIVDNDAVYKSGRYFVGVGNYFIKYPITYQTIDFSDDPEGSGGPPLSIFSSEGQTITCEISYFYRIDETRIHDLYKIAAMNYEVLLERKSQEVLKNVASRYRTTDFFLNREVISNEMRVTLNYELYSTFYVFVPVLQLRGISLPTELESALVDKVVAEQNQKTETLRRNITLINQDTQIQQAIAQNQVVQTLQAAQSYAYSVKQNAEALVKKALLDANAQAINSFNSLGWSNSSQLVNFIFTDFLGREPADTTFFIGFGGSVVVQPK
jgi:regulator of protease activity HflC (stomatin/prohibitin superfamily)